MRQLTIKPLDSSVQEVFARLIQYYECEFSSITQKKPRADGTFALDFVPQATVSVYLAYDEGLPAGFAVIKEQKPHSFEVLDFFIVPVFRRHGCGLALASSLWELLPGDWEIKQIAGADAATAFWRKAIGRYTGGHFTEDRFQDHYWGDVTRQRFKSVVR